MTDTSHTPLDAILRAAAIRDDRRLEQAIEQAAKVLEAPPQASTVTPVEAALWYASQGLPVFPLQPGSKIPTPGSRGVNDATLDRDRIVAWFDGTERNVGLAAGHRFDVIDIDGPDGAAAFDDLVGDDGAPWLNPRGVVKTPKGFHLYVPAVDGATNGQNNGSHVDYRARGGYVVAPPSVVDGGQYRWLLPPATEAEV